MRVALDAKYVAQGLDLLLQTRKPRVNTAGGLSARVLMPPVFPLDDVGLLEGDEWFVHPDDFTPDILPQANVAILNPTPNGQTGIGWGFDWVRPASSQSRRKARFGAKYMLDHTFGHVLEDGTWDHFETRPVSWINGRWRDALGAMRVSNMRGGARGYREVIHGTEAFGDEHHNRVQMALSIALTLRYRYSLVLSASDNCMAARIFATAETLRFMLRTRALGNLDRRRALTHLVRRHLRRKHKPSIVRQHLRGEYRCTWAGMNVSLLPSQYDLEHSIEGAFTERLEDAALLRWIGTPGMAAA